MMKFNQHRCKGFCVDCSKAGIEDVLVDVKPTYLQKVVCQSLFKCFCKTTCGTAKRLDMHGSFVHEKIGRRFLDIDVPALLVFLSKHPEITHISLAGNNITDYGFVNLVDHILNSGNIVELDIQNNEIVNHGLRYLLETRKRLRLTSLNLRGNKLDIEASKNVALFLLENTHMQSLNIADVNQTASSLIYFMMVLSTDQEQSNKTLKSLDISRPNPGCMYFFDSTHFADVIGHMLRHNTTLAAIHLQKYSFSCHDIEIMVSNAICNNSLHLLDLGCNNIGDHGIDHLSEWLKRRPALKVLILCRNIITDHGARSLSYSVPFSRLLSLDVSYNKITDDGMIVKRMLLSRVLSQENIDVRPYRVDHVWYVARYDGERCRKEYEDVPYGLFTETQKQSHSLARSSKKYCKYTYAATTELSFKHSTLTIISKALSREHIKDCKCCYCFKCEAFHYDEECRKADHPNTCTCCKCKGSQSSDWSIDESVLKRVVTPPDPMKNIEYVLRRVNSETRDKILRWTNIDKETLEEDLKLIGDPNASDEKSESTPSCTCSWVQLNMSALQKYLQGSSSRNLLIVPKDYSKCFNESSENSVSLDYCSSTK